MFGRALVTGLTMLALGCGSPSNTSPVPNEPSGGGGAITGGGGALGGGALGGGGAGGTPWVSPVAPEVSRQWSWQECGRIAPGPGVEELQNLSGVAITSLAISADGSLLASNGFSAIGWRVAEAFAQSQPVWRVGVEGAYNVALSADGRFGSVSGDVRTVLDAQTGERLYTEDAAYFDLRQTPCIGSELNFSPDGGLVAGKHYTSVVDVLETRSFTRVGRFQTGGCAQGVAFDATGTVIRTPDGMGVVAALTDTVPEGTPNQTTSPWWFETLTPAPDGSFATTSCDQFGCQSSGLSWGGSHGRVTISAEGHWWSLGGMLEHAPSGETRIVDESASSSLFAPNGDLIVGEVDGSLVRFCRSE